MSLPGLFLQARQKKLQIFFPLHERLAMIGEWQGNQAAPGEPALNTAKQEAILQRFVGRRSRERKRFIAVRPAERLEPSGRVKDGRSGMARQELLPARVLERINPVKGL